MFQNLYGKVSTVPPATLDPELNLRSSLPLAATCFPHQAPNSLLFADVCSLQTAVLFASGERVKGGHDSISCLFCSVVTSHRDAWEGKGRGNGRDNLGLQWRLLLPFLLQWG